MPHQMLSLCLPDPFILEVVHLEKNAKKYHKGKPEKQKQSSKQKKTKLQAKMEQHSMFVKMVGEWILYDMIRFRFQ